MVTNYTPLDIEKLKKEDNKTVTILLTILMITLAVLVILMFFLIQKQMKKIRSESFLTPSPAMVSPTLLPEESPVEKLDQPPTLEPTLSSSPSSQLEMMMEEKVFSTTQSSSLDGSNE